MSYDSGTVLTFGCWDLFHLGHLRFLERAAGLGRRLIVGMAADAVVVRDKGRAPVVGQGERFAVLSALRYVDRVHLYTTFDFVPTLLEYRPEVLAVGAEWGVADRHTAAEVMVTGWGGRLVRLLRTDGVSTSGRVAEIVRRYGGAVGG